MEKKIAIFNYSGICKNTGGPSGYLYNLFEGLKEASTTIPLFSVVQTNKQQGGSTTPKINSPFVQEIRSLLYLIKKGINCSKKVSKEIHEYDIIHTHSCEDVFYLRRFIKYNGKIILTSHRPQPLEDESVIPLKLKLGTKWNFPFFRFIITQIEKYGYKECSGFIFPSEGAMKIYNDFPGFKKFSKNKPINYVFTGAKIENPTIPTKDYREKLSLSKHDKVICYIGRHNYIKGYDLLVSLADRLEKEDIKVICAGAISGIPVPKNKNWIELGHISDPSNLINASDIVVIPNRNTYFDLIIVEILSLGKMIVTSKTGGNIDIAKQTKGLRLFKSGDSENLYQTIIDSFNLPAEEKEKLSDENLDFYNQNCTINKFTKNYMVALNKVCSKLCS
ncbi:glycosyltransferase family 4 protein [Fredinandcohnia sp. 179-A 10B2 NHS]|uniref:glycosyltransferase family 4 protein n=1 Tax=Fredinandcohnia sp. 179-A 10B2 NHS TaxID=3235176 RepID=UPI0039A3CC85